MTWAFQALLLLLVALILYAILTIERRLSALQASLDASFTGSPTRLIHGYTTLYPVFTEKEVRSANTAAFEANEQAVRKENALMSDPMFKQACAARNISAPIAEKMLELCEARTEGEWLWYRHAILMDANTSVVSGRSTRDEALETAMKRLEAVPTDYFDAVPHFTRMRDEWKMQLEDPFHTEHARSPRPYSNPWSQRDIDCFHPEHLSWLKGDDDEADVECEP